jgi:DNA-binding NarL/FixJ family response regulator
MPYDVLLVEDHAMVRELMRRMLELHSDFRVVGAVESGGEAVQFCKQHAPHVVVMDLSLPGLNGVDSTVEVLRHCPTAKVLVVTMHDDDQHIIGAIRAGAKGFVVKQANPDELLEALRVVARGGTFLSGKVSQSLLARIQAGNFDATPVSSALDVLSPRERQVLSLVADGKTSKEIAVALDLSLETVRSYRKTLMKKLNVNNVATLTQLALAAGVTETRVAPVTTRGAV